MPMLWEVQTAMNDPAVLIDLARKATALRPHVAKNWEVLAHNLLRIAAVEEAIAVLSEAKSKLPAEPRLKLMLAAAYYRAGRFDDAQESLHRASAVPNEDRGTTIFRLELLMKMRAAKTLAQAATDAIALDPTNKFALEALSKVSRDDGRPEIMIPICQAALKQKPWHPQARYELAVAFAMLGRLEEARQLIDLNQFITITELATPDAYTNAEAFEAALASEVANDPTLRPDPVGKATKGGLQTMNGLPHVGERAIGVLLDLIRLAVDAFEANLAEGPDHPFVQRRPKRARLDAWAVIYPGDGRQVAHIHPDGWLSGVYYVTVPKTSCDEPRSGCLVLGSLEMKRQSVDPPWGIRDIRPVPGRLVLFPSYIPHATIPTKSTAARISISFDVIPTAQD
jgi:uncharacterized protein (TIGR02466 family)